MLKNGLNYKNVECIQDFYEKSSFASLWISYQGDLVQVCKIQNSR